MWHQRGEWGGSLKSLLETGDPLCHLLWPDTKLVVHSTDGAAWALRDTRSPYTMPKMPSGTVVCSPEPPKPQLCPAHPEGS